MHRYANKFKETGVLVVTEFGGLRGFKFNPKVFTFVIIKKSFKSDFRFLI